MLVTVSKVELFKKINLNKIFVLIISYFLFLYLSIINSTKIYSIFLFLLTISITIVVLWDKTKKCLSTFILIILIATMIIFNYKIKQLFYINPHTISIYNESNTDIPYNVFSSKSLMLTYHILFFLSKSLVWTSVASFFALPNVLDFRSRLL